MSTCARHGDKPPFGVPAVQTEIPASAAAEGVGGKSEAGNPFRNRRDPQQLEYEFAERYLGFAAER